MNWRAVACLVGAVAASLGGCQCEESVREAVSRDNVKKYFDDTGEEESESSEEEPNDVPEQATLVEMTDALRSTTGELSDGDDRDWFALRRDEDATNLVTLRVRPTDEELNPAIVLETEGDGGETIVYDSSGAGDAEVVHNLDWSDPVRRVGVVNEEGTSGGYELVFDRRLTEGAVEREPNDSSETATRFEFPGSVEGRYGREGDVDWFQVLSDDANPGIYQLDLDGSEGLEQTVELYTERDANEPYFAMTASGDGKLEIPNVRIPGDADGLWFRLEREDGGDGEATYQMRMVEHPRIPKRRVEAEPNGERERSVGMTVGGRVAGYFHRPDDRDLFHLAVGRSLPESSVDAGVPESDAGPEGPGDTGTESGPRDTTRDPKDAGGSGMPPLLAKLPDKEAPPHVLQFRLEPGAEGHVLRLNRWRAGWDGESVAREAGGAGEPVEICNVGVDRGLVRLEVSASETGEHEKPGRRGFDYEITAEDLSTKHAGLEVEPNDERSRADRVEFGGSRTAFIGESDDRDVFGFAVPESSEHSGGDESDAAGRSEGPELHPVRVEVLANSLDLSFDIVDAQGGLVVEADRHGAGGDEVTEVELPAGVYYARVESRTDRACEPYRVTVERGGADPGDAGGIPSGPDDQ